MSSILWQYSKIENFSKNYILKKWTEWRAGLASTSPWRAKVSQCRKTERGDHSDTQSVVKYQRNWRGTLCREKKLGKKVSQCRKKLKGGTLWDFSTSILSQNIKKNAGGPFGKNFFRKSLTVPKKMKGGTLWSRPVWYVTRKNRKNLFGSVR